MTHLARYLAPGIVLAFLVAAAQAQPTPRAASAATGAQPTTAEALPPGPGQPRPAQPVSPENPGAYDARTVGEQVQAYAAVIRLYEAQLRAAAQDQARLAQRAQDDLKQLDATWRREFDGWCAGRPACGLQSAPAATQSPPPTPDQPR